MSAFTPASEVLLRHSDDFESARVLFAGDLQDDLPARLDTVASRAHTQQFHHWQVLSRQMGENARYSLVAEAGDVADCESPFAVEGDHANAVQLRAMRQQICGEEERYNAEREGRISDVNALDSLNSSMESEFGENVFSPGGIAPSINQKWLTFGSGQCPQFSIAVPWGGTWQAPPEFCSMVAAIRALFILAAYLWALRLVSE